MFRRLSLVAAVVLALIAYGTPANAQQSFRPGAAGIGDPYFPLSGNGGYDVQHYGLDIKYTPANDRLAGVAMITARATQNLSAFNLDFHGLTLRSLTVDGRSARLEPDGGELTVTPRKGLRKGPRSRWWPATTACRGSSRDQIWATPGSSTPTTAWSSSASRGRLDLVPGQRPPAGQGRLHRRTPRPAASKPSPTASCSSPTTGPWTTWTWNAKEPMASYLATATVGEFKTTPTPRPGCSTGTRSTRICSPPPRPAQRHPAGQQPDRRTGVQAAHPHHRRARRRRPADLPGDPGDRVGLGLLLRRGAHRRRGRLDHAAGRQRAQQRRTPATSAVAGDVHPFLLTLPHPHRGRRLHADRRHRRLERRPGVSNGYEQWSIDLSAYAGRPSRCRCRYERPRR